MQMHGRQEQMMEPMLATQYDNEQLIRIQQRMEGISAVTNRLESIQKNVDLQIGALLESSNQNTEMIAKAHREILKKRIATQEENVRLFWWSVGVVVALIILVLVVSGIRG